jgi:hypothetical protein
VRFIMVNGQDSADTMVPSYDQYIILAGG